ncbi:hypothetical protein BDZ97DRAFT_1106936 [Flammula alnicola]|nr:hypothetical protein BDZ97DRAFT_1106936 [Flammula alnicola]
MFSLSSPLSLCAIPIMWLIAYYPSTVRLIIMNTQSEYNNVQPRSNLLEIESKKGISPQMAARIQRMEGAHVNTLENLPFFGLAVITGNYAGIDNVTLNIVSGLYLAARILYTYIYINQSNAVHAFFRSFVWVISITFPFYLFMKSAYLLGPQAL